MLNMARPEKVASVLNRLTDRAFIDALTSGDKERMSDFITDYLCVDPDMDVSNKCGRGGAQ